MAIIKIRNTAIDLDAAEIPNIDASKITSGTISSSRISGLPASSISSGTFSDARIAASNVSQHASSFDDNKIVNDISTLAIRQSSNENKAAYGGSSMYVDVFQDGTGISANTNAPRNASEYVSTAVGDTGLVFLMDGGETESVGSTNFYNLSSGVAVNRDGINGSGDSIRVRDTQKKFGSNAYYYENSSSSHDYRHYFNANSDWDFGTGDFSIDGFIYYTADAHEMSIMGVGTGSTNGDYFIRINEWNSDQLVFNTKYSTNGHANIPSTGISPNTWLHICVARKSGVLKIFIDGVSRTITSSTNWATMPVGNTAGQLQWGTSMYAGTGMYGYIDGWRMYKGTAKYFDANFTPPTSQPVAATTSATGNFISNAITASASTNKMGAIITYQDQAGTNTLNTDIVLQLSADGGSNFTTATLTALPDFSTGIKMCKVNDLTIGTAGTSLKYKLSFANQSAGSKEARIRGVSLQY